MVRCCSFSLLGALLVTAVLSPVDAADIRWRDGDEEIGGFGAGIYLTGEITPRDFHKLEKVYWGTASEQSALWLLGPGGEWLTQKTFGFAPLEIYLNSPGGNVEEAIRIGEFVRRFSIRTSAPTTRRIPGPTSTYIGVFGDGGPEFACASACAFVWLAGRWRTGDRVAFHRPYEAVLQGRRTGAELAQSARTVRQITKSYLSQLGVDERIYPAIMSQSHEESLWLSDLRKQADVPELSIEFEEQVINASGISDSAKRAISDNYIDLLKRRDIESMDRYNEAIECAEWELSNLQGEAYHMAVDAEVRRRSDKISGRSLAFSERRWPQASSQSG